VTIQQPEFTVFDQSVGILEIREASSNRFDFGSSQSDSSLKFFQQEIVM